MEKEELCWFDFENLNESELRDLIRELCRHLDLKVTALKYHDSQNREFKIETASGPL